MSGIRFDPNGEYCIGDTGRREMLVNMERYRAALDKCNSTIREYNATVTK